jgi:hypothetical protein
LQRQAPALCGLCRTDRRITEAERCGAAVRERFGQAPFHARGMHADERLERAARIAHLDLGERALGAKVERRRRVRGHDRSVVRG